MSHISIHADEGDSINEEVGGLTVQCHSADKQFDAKEWIDRQLEACETSTCAIDLLLEADSPRLAGEVDEHARLLAQSPVSLPPIIAHKPSRRVIDGMHRLAAAKIRGDTEIQVRWYEGDERDAFAIAVQTNVAHGLPLSLADRRQAAARIMESHADWSNRMIAAIVNLSPSTVGSVRATLAVEHNSNARLSSDGRRRPVTTVEERRRAGELFRENPGISVREVARNTGLAPSTVLDVRNRILEGRDPVPEGQRRHGTGARRQRDEEVSATNNDSVRRRDYRAILQSAAKDPSLRYNDAGRMLLQWLHAGPAGADTDTRSRLMEQLPSHCVGLIVSLAREQAEAWQEFSCQLDSRSVSLAEPL